MAQKGRPFNPAVETAAGLLLEDQRRDDIVEAIERWAQNQKSHGRRLICPACRALLHADAFDNCSLCGWASGQRCPEVTRRKYLMALACGAAWGLWAIPCLRTLRFAGGYAIHALCHLTRYPEKAQGIAAAVHPAFASLPDLLQGKIWPRAPWPRVQKDDLFTVYEPGLIVGEFRALSEAAWVALRCARWPTKPAACLNPKCGLPAIFHGRHYVGPDKTGGNYYRKWRCMDKKERAAFNERRREKRRALARASSSGKLVIWRNIASHRAGCGVAFSDLTNTPFAGRQIPMADWLMLFCGDVYTIDLFLKIGISPKRVVSMIAGLCQLSENAPDFLERWGLTADMVVRVVKRGCAVGN